MEMSFVIWLCVGLAIYFACQHLDTKLDHHPPITVNARYPVVYDAVIKAIKTFSYEDYSWFISFVDPEQGHIQAKCRFREKVSEHLRNERRAIDLDVYLVQTEKGVTQLTYWFSVTSPYGRLEASNIIHVMEVYLQGELRKAVALSANAGRGTVTSEEKAA